MGGREVASAERSARGVAQLAPFRKSGYRYVMDALAARGNAADALRIYDRPCRLLREELGVASGAAAQELHGRLLAQLDAVRPGD